MRAGSVSSLLVFETMFMAGSPFLPKFKRCQESSPLLGGGPEQFLASHGSPLSCFQLGCLTVGQECPKEP